MKAGGSGALVVTIVAHGILRIAASSSAVLVGLYLAQLRNQGLPIGVGLLGALGAVAFAAELFFSIPLGFVSDAVSPRWLMISGAVLGAFAAQLFGLSPHVPVFFLSRLLEGVGAAAVTPPLLAFLADSTAGNPPLRARTMSLFELSLLAGVALGGVVASQLWLRLQLSAFSVVAAIYLSTAALLWLAAFPKKALGAPAAFQALRHAWADASVRRLAPVWLCVNSLVGLWLGPTLSFLLTERPSSPQYLDGIFFNHPTRVGWVLLGYAILFGMGVSGWAIVLPGVRILSAMRISLLAILPVCLGFYLINHSHNFSPGLRWLVGIMTALLILVESGFTPAALALLAQSIGAATGKGSTMGIYSVLLSLGAIVGSILAGALGKILRVDGLLLGTVVMGACALFSLRNLAKMQQQAR